MVYLFVFSDCEEEKVVGPALPPGFKPSTQSSSGSSDSSSDSSDSDSDRPSKRKHTHGPQTPFSEPLAKRLKPQLAEGKMIEPSHVYSSIKSNSS